MVLTYRANIVFALPGEPRVLLDQVMAAPLTTSPRGLAEYCDRAGIKFVPVLLLWT